MALIGSYRYSSAASGSTAIADEPIANFTGFQISGLATSNALAVCMYVWDTAGQKWKPYAP